MTDAAHAPTPPAASGETTREPLAVVQCLCGVFAYLCDAPICNACEVEANYPDGWFTDGEGELTFIAATHQGTR